MPVVTIFGLPRMPKQKLSTLRSEVKTAVLGITELKLTGLADVTVFCLSDMVEELSASEIIAHVTELFVKPERTKEVQDRVAGVIGRILHTHYPDALVEVPVYPLDPTVCGFWSSAKSR